MERTRMGDKYIPYFEKLKDTRWQRVRLLVMERENFTCENCLATDRTLNVHHGFYSYGIEPWDLPTDSMHCLCESCHEIIQEIGRDGRLALARLPAWMLESVVNELVRKCDKYIGRQRKGIDDPAHVGHGES